MQGIKLVSYTLSPFIIINRLNDAFAAYDFKYSKTFVLEKSYQWIIDSIKGDKLSLSELFDSRPDKHLNIEQLSLVIEQFENSKIVVQTS